ncbi:putative neuraminidase [Pedobacter cryoconitis]|uniref:Putative neuraminidase n=1 Tax=Pedobacter cryoconitis TaxID=188932 RepID=A0A7W8YSA2_9SPHI|nr:sialidase family protein [Pedobacter cryoconitis]MBB5620885.1 putative neuraminidase [Pedobacter cryoconitis]
MKLFHLSLLLLILCCTERLSAQENQAFRNAPKVINDPGNFYKYAEHSRKFSGIPSITVTSNGTLWATWYAGMTSGEDANNYVVLATSKDQGVTWKEILVVDPDEKGPVRAYDPEIWIDPAGKLWLFWAQTIGLEGSVAGVWAMTANDPDSENPVWTSAKRLSDGIMMCKPTVLSTGEWLLPVSTWRLTDESAKVVMSTDKGANWAVKGACNVPEADREFDEHMLVERKDRSLWMLLRTRYGIAESFSIDKGKSWSVAKPSALLHTSSRFFIRRLNSGNLLLIKHGPIAVKTGRSHLMAFISKNDGKTWSRGLLIDERAGISYPDAQQAADNKIYLTYDYNRTLDQQIIMTVFTEKDILSEDYNAAMVKVFNERKMISKK